MCARRMRVAIVVVVLLGVAAVGMLGLSRVLVVVKVAGESMHPALHTADVCLIRQGDRIHEGDVVLYVGPGHREAVLHRVVGRAPDGWVTRGDANPVADFDHLPASAIRGRLIAVAPVGALLERWRLRSGGATLHNQSQTARQ